MTFCKSVFVRIGFVIMAASALCAQTTDSHVLSALRSSLSAMGVSGVQDVQLKGSVEHFAGASDEKGSVQIVATMAGSSRIDLQFPSGSRSEVRAVTDQGLVANWFGTDGTEHTISGHNLMTTGAWCFPGLVLEDLVSSKSTTVTYAGQENRNGYSVLHFVALTTPSVSDTTVLPLLQHLSQTDIYLDSSTFIPVALRFNTHPDADLKTEILVEIRFSGYQKISGISIPLRVEKYVNDTLSLDFQFQSAAFNTGISVVSSAVQ